MRKLLALVLIMPAAGCVYPHPPPPPPPPELGAAAARCADTIFPIDPRIGPWSVDKFAGHYRRGQLALTVTRDNHRLLVMRPGFGTREIATDNIESWKWHDACGVRYEFALPPDGPGAWLKITDVGNIVSEWNRAAH